MIELAADGQKYFTLLKAGKLLGGYVAGGMLSYGDAESLLRSAIESKANVRSLETAHKAIATSLDHGQQNPIQFEELERQRIEYLEANGFNGPGRTTDSNGEGPKPEWAAGYTEQPKNSEPEKSCFSDINFGDISIRRFMGREPQPVKWTLNESLPAGRFGMVVADGGTGKGFVLLQMGVSVSTGTPFLDGLYDVADPGTVVLICGEDDDEDVDHRLNGILRSFGEDGLEEQFLARLNNNLHAFSVRGADARLVQNVEDPLPTRAYEDLLELLKPINDLKLVVLDPLSRFYVGDENSAPDATYFSSLMERLAQETGATVLVSQHTNKASGMGRQAVTQHAVRGSTGFTNAARWQMNLARVDPTDWRDLGVKREEIHNYVVGRVVKKNMGAPEDFFYLRHDGTGTLRRAYVEPALSDQDKEVLGDLLELLAEMEQREKPKRYTKRSFARDFAKYDKWPKYGSRKLEALVSYALDQGLLFIEECRNAQNSPVDYLTLRKSENSAR